MSTDEALQTLRDAVKTPRGRSALSVLESELGAGGKQTQGQKTSGKPSGFPKKGGVPAALAAAAAAKSAKGGATA